MTSVVRKQDKEHIGCLSHLLNLIVKRFFNCKIFESQLDESQDENSDKDEFDDILDLLMNSVLYIRFKFCNKSLASEVISKSDKKYSDLWCSRL